MRKIRSTFLLASLFLTALLSWGFFVAGDAPEDTWGEKTPVSFILKDLGEPAAKHTVENWGPELVKRGQQLVMQGAATGPNGEKGARISQYFTCTSCHNTVREDPDLSKISPEARLDHSAEKNVPLFQATTFYGIVNRESWFNGDYEKRYGDRAKASQNDLREAIRLCSEECSQGRVLEPWEEEAILAYFWSLEVRLEDLNLSESDLNTLKEVPEKEKKRKAHVKWFKEFYPLASPATFGEVPVDVAKGYGLVGVPENGKRIFDFACQKCHMYGVANLNFYDSNDTFQQWMKNTAEGNTGSIYRVLREGTEPTAEKPLYMPRFTQERLSDQQIEDLKAYAAQRAEEDY